MEPRDIGNYGLIVLPDAHEIYFQKIDFFQYVRALRICSDVSILIESYPDEYIVITRRKGNKWFTGAITDESARKIELTMSFLESESRYHVRVFEDAETSHYHR